MPQLTPEGKKIVEGLAQTHAFSVEAVTVLLRALVAGGGFQAQFSHPDLGGMGQWSQGGMIMIGDMFNQGLKYRVSALCEELAGLVRSQPLLARAPIQSQSQSQNGSSQASAFQGDGAGVSLFVPGADSNAWWPVDLGAPASTGAQNDLRYACFPGARRLAIRQGGETRIYDTGEHLIGGFSQQQGGDQSLTFTSQFGLVRVADLPQVFPAPQVSPAQQVSPTPESAEAPRAFAPAVAQPDAASFPAPAGSTSSDAIFAMLEKLADLRQKSILTDDEFAAKKVELLARL